MKRLLTKVRTALALGLANIAHVTGYRLTVFLGINPVRRLQGNVPHAPFFKAVASTNEVIAPTVSSWNKSAMLFSRWPMTLTNAPVAWLSNPLNDQRMAEPERDWWLIPDFDPEVGDIKLIWELSRMDWVLAFAQRASKGDEIALSQLNEWMEDWCTCNPPYKGPNWKCGQEASIRVMHLAMAAVILGQTDKAENGLSDLIRIHLQRIAPTVQYAMAQDNNHGTSEAAALFIGGSWLAHLGCTEGKTWEQTGRKMLENRVARLIGPQGSFSQYSLNYHRVLLDTLCMVEIWRLRKKLPKFSILWQQRALSATLWLHHFVNPINGDGPNVGANDGARLLQLTDTSYRDHRPTIQLSMALFAHKRAFTKSGPWDDALAWLGVDLPYEPATVPGSYIADDGGFAILRRGDAMAMLRYPRFRFRPSQSDALHLDFWLEGDNLLRDAGTYSYNTNALWFEYFNGTSSHNTIQFDRRDQMPRLSRFLLGNWLKTDRVSSIREDILGTHFAAGYRDSNNARHHRNISLENTSLHVTDEVQGFQNQAVLRWRLKPGDWRLEQLGDVQQLSLISEQKITLAVSADVPITRCELVQGWESRHYQEKTPLPVLEIEIQQAGTIKTDLQWMV